MNKENIEQRHDGAGSETFIIAKCDEGFRVCSPLTPAKQFVVSGIPENPTCTCPDFEVHAHDPEWCCQHLLAVRNHLVKQNHRPPGNNGSGTSASTDSPRTGEPPAQKRATRNGGAVMLIKRSLSPDGKIDSLSVEFSFPVGKTTSEEIKQKAEKTLKLQAEIMEGFLKANGRNGKGNGQPAGKGNGSNGSVTAQMLGIGSMNSKWGKRLFINVLVNGETPSKLFGSHKQLVEAVTAAGFPGVADHVAEGVELNLPCRVTTKPSQDGKYLNIDRVMPLKALAAPGAV